jgi:phosphoglycolate phosphatase-like HAD superfamily hydrolase
MDILTFFDIDNTLIQSSTGHVEALLLSIAEVYGLEASIEVINHHGMTDQEIITRLLEEYGIDRAAIKSGLKDCMESMSRKYAEIVNSEKIVVMRGVFDLLPKLEQNGVILGLVTGNLEKIARCKLKKIGIDQFFKIGGFGSDHINRGELVKIAIQRAGDRFNCGHKRRVFHFGDAPQDMKAGRTAGVVPVGVATGIFTADQLTAAGAETVFPDLTDADEILKMMLKTNRR